MFSFKSQLKANFSFTVHCFSVFRIMLLEKSLPSLRLMILKILQWFPLQSRQVSLAELSGTERWKHGEVKPGMNAGRINSHSCVKLREPET